MSGLENALWLCGILLASFAARYIPRRLLPDAVLSDAYFHLAMSREIRRLGHRLPELVPRVELSPDYTYPYLYHWLLSWIPDRHLQVAERLSGAVVDTAYTLLTYFIALKLLPQLGVSAGDSAGLSLLVALFVGFHPAFLVMGVGPRAYSASPRPLGQLVFLAYFAGCTFSLESAAWPWLVVAVGSAALMPVTSKFGMQAMLFIPAGLALCGYVVPLAAALSGTLIAIAWTRGKALTVLRGQLAHSTFYFLYLQKRFLHPNYRSLWQYVRTGLAMLRRSPSAPMRFVEWLFTERHFLHRCILCFPHVWIFGAILVYRYDVASNSTMKFVLFAVAVSFAIGVLTAMKPLMFLGEPERYPEHTVSLQVIVLVALLEDLNEWAPGFWLLSYSAGAYVLSVRLFATRFAAWSRFAKDVPVAVSAIDCPNALVMAVGALFWPVLYCSRALRLYFHGANLDRRRLDLGKWLEVFGHFPYPGVRPGRLRELTGVDYMIGTRTELEHYAGLVGEPNFPDGSAYPVIARSGEVMVVGLRLGDAGAPLRTGPWLASA